jgi:hypothetical protein
MGVFKELLIDHSLDGELLPDNILIVAACNPARDKIEVAGDRREELGNEWAIGHYQVHPLPTSLQHLLWDYGSLKPDQEKEFIQKRVQLLQVKEGLSDTEADTLAKLVYDSQQRTREFAQEHIKSLVEAKRGSVVSSSELAARASSSVSLRDILRVFKLFSYLTAMPSKASAVFLQGLGDAERNRNRAMVLAIAVVYYLRLGSSSSNPDLDFRKKFRNRLQSSCGEQDADVEGVLIRAMSALMGQTFLEPGIAKTRGLQENILMTVVCCLARVPLMIVGPPGSSKTLALTIVAENARGEYSKSEFYKVVPTLVPFHYQCSRRSTSHEIKAVFERAIERQAKTDEDQGNSRCFVFMDEAGLPEEGRESLKVLHYYLEDYMAVKARVGFVAITNHLLDAAKSNRCALLTRTKPDHEELMNVARGCLGSDEERQQLTSTVMGMHRGRPVLLKLDPLSLDSSQVGLLDLLCETYDACMSEQRRPRALPGEQSPPEDFVTFFGLRDFMHFIKLLGRLAKEDCKDPTVSRDKIVKALERNMNGVEPMKLRELLNYFLMPLSEANPSDVLPALVLSNPLDLMCKSLAEQAKAAAPINRYKLVIDTTADDSVLRALHRVLNVDGACEILKLSQFSGDTGVQSINVISRVKWAAEKGQLVLLSQTERINESFYDLFNQHFRKFVDQSKSEAEVIYHTNIAVGAHSRRCKVEQGFQCIVHLTLAELQLAPAPFLNRFEKYRLTQADLLQSHLHRSELLRTLPSLKELLSQPKLMAHIQDFVQQIGVRSFYGFTESQTIESGLLCLLSDWQTLKGVVNSIMCHFENDAFRLSIEAELEGDQSAAACAMSLRGNSQGISQVLKEPTTEEQRTAGKTLLAQCIVHELISRLLRIVVPEQVFQHPGALPDGILRTYLAQNEHFSFRALLRAVEDGPTRKHVVYTRTSEVVLALQTGDAAATSRLEHLVNSDDSSEITCSLLCFAHLTRESQLIDELDSFRSLDDPRSVLLIFMDGTQTATSQINFARHKIDEMLNQCATKSVVVLLHVPAPDLLVHPCYDTTFCPDWRTTFLDSVEAEEISSWLELGAGLSGSWSLVRVVTVLFTTWILITIFW